MKQNIMKGRLWALLLSIAMVLTMMPAMAFTAFASEPRVVKVSNGDDLLSAFEDAKDGDIIELQKGITDLRKDLKLQGDDNASVIIDVNGYRIQTPSKIGVDNNSNRTLVFRNKIFGSDNEPTIFSYVQPSSFSAPDKSQLVFESGTYKKDVRQYAIKEGSTVTTNGLNYIVTPNKPALFEARAMVKIHGEDKEHRLTDYWDLWNTAKDLNKEVDIILYDDFELSSGDSFNNLGSRTYNLYLNGHKITTDNPNGIFDLWGGGTVNIKGTKQGSELYSNVGGPVIKTNYNAECTVNINGGCYESKESTWLKRADSGDKGHITITAGTFDADPTAYKAENSKVTDNHDGTWTVTANVAKIDDKLYETLQAAFDAADSGDVVKLIANIEPEFSKVYATVNRNKNIELDIAGKTINGSSTSTGYTQLILIENGGELTIRDSVGNGALKYTDTKDDTGGSTLRVHGKLTLESGLVENLTKCEKSAIQAAIDVYANEWGKEYDPKDVVFNMNGGVVKSNKDNTIRLTNFSGTSQSGKSTSVIVTVKDGLVQGGADAFFIQAPSANKFDKNILNIKGGTFDCKQPVRIFGNGFTSEFQGEEIPVIVNITGGNFNRGDKQKTFWKSVAIQNLGKDDNVDLIKSYADVSIEGGFFNYNDSVAEGVVEGKTCVENEAYDANETDVININHYQYTIGNAKAYVAQITSDGKTTKYETLQDAFNDAKSGDTIILLANTKLSKELEVSKSVTLDMNGYNIDADTHSIKVENGALNLTGEGEISGKPSAQKLIYLKGSTDPGAENYSNLIVGEDVTLRTSTGAYGIMISQNDGCAYGVNIEVNGAVNTPYGIYVNGSINKTEGNVPNIVINGTVDEGIYAAGYANWIINATMTGEGPLSLKSGNIVINGGTYTATGEYKNPADGNNNGSEDTGAALSLTSNDSYAKILNVTVNDGVFTSKNGNAVYEGIAVKDTTPVATKSYATIAINGGKFKSASGKKVVDITTAKKKDVISGGHFSDKPDASYIAEGKEVTDDTVDYKARGYYWTIKDKTAATILTYSVDTSSNWGIGTVSGGGTAKVGETISLHASSVEGHKFVKWAVVDSDYEIGSGYYPSKMHELSTDDNYKWTVDDTYADDNGNIRIVAVYEVLRPSANVTAVGKIVGSDDVITIDPQITGDIGEQNIGKHKTIKAQEEVVGSDEKTYKFRYWANDNNNILTKNSEYAFDLFADVSAKAVYTVEDTSIVLVTFQSEEKQLLSAKTYTINPETGVNIEEDVAPSKLGFKFSDWSINGTDKATFEQIQTEAANNGNGAVSVVPLYTPSQATYNVTVDMYIVKDSQLQKVKSKQVVSGEFVGVPHEITATEECVYEGVTYKFSKFTTNDEDDPVILSTTRTMTLRPSVAETTVRAIYETEPVGETAVVAMTDCGKEDEISAKTGESFKKIFFTTSYIVPDNYEIKEVGIWYTTNQSKAAAETPDGGTYEASSLKSNKGNFTLHIDVTGYLNVKVYARGYVKYVNGDGHVITIFSENVMSRSYND